MGHGEVSEQLQPDVVGNGSVLIPSTASVGEAMVALQTGNGTCSCGGAGSDGAETIETTYVYAIGRVEARFPSQGIEKEVAQVVARMDTAGLTKEQVLHRVLEQNHYLVRQVCWVFLVEGLETYLLQPTCPADLELLVRAIEPVSNRTEDLDLVIGRRGPIAPPHMCNGLMIPVVAFDQIYSFTRDELLDSIPTPESLEAAQFRNSANSLLTHIMQLADNAGATDEHRAINYLAVRYPQIYALSTESDSHSKSLTGVETRPSRLSGTRKIVDVIFSYTHRQTDITEKYFVRVDVTEEFPFLVTRLGQFFER